MYILFLKSVPYGQRKERKGVFCSNGRKPTTTTMQCTHTETKRKGQAEASFHGLPVKDIERCKLWLWAIKKLKYEENAANESVKLQRICTHHFKPEDVEHNVTGNMVSNVAIAEDSGGKL